MTTPPTPPRDLREYDRDGIAGTIHPVDPAAVARHDAGEDWKTIAADYGMSHTTLAQRIAEAQHVARQAAKQQEKPQ